MVALNDPHDAIGRVFREIIQASAVGEEVYERVLNESHGPLHLRISTTFILAGSLSVHQQKKTAQYFDQFVQWLTDATDEEIRALYVKE